MSGLRERLAKARFKTWSFPVPLADEKTMDAAREALQQARGRLRVVEMNESPAKDRKAAERAVAAAEEALDALFEHVQIRPLTDDDDLDALLAAHTNDDGEQDTAAIELALLAECTDLSVDEWRDVLAGWPRPERRALFAKVWEANSRPSYEGVPKD